MPALGNLWNAFVADLRDQLVLLKDQIVQTIGRPTWDLLADNWEIGLGLLIALVAVRSKAIRTILTGLTTFIATGLLGGRVWGGC